MKKLLGILTGIVSVFALATPVLADEQMVVNRGLPNINLNNVAGANRSNVAWSNGNEYVSGDDFTIGKTGEKWIVTGIRTWSVGNKPFLGDIFSSISLYTGTGGVSLLATGNLTAGSNSNSNSDIKHRVVMYPGTDITYQGSSGTFRTLWQHDFKDLDLKINGGVKYYFAVDGILRNPDTYYWFNHASNKALSGTPQDGSDNKWLVWDKNNLTSTPHICNSLGPITGICDGGWDKSSDINIQVFAEKVDSEDNDQGENQELKSFTAKDSLYYNCPTVCPDLYGTGAISFTWDEKTGEVKSGYWNEVVPPHSGTVYYNVVDHGTVIGNHVDLTFVRTVPNSYGPFHLIGTLTDEVLTGTAAGPYFFTATSE